MTLMRIPGHDSMLLRGLPEDLPDLEPQPHHWDAARSAINTDLQRVASFFMDSDDRDVYARLLLSNDDFREAFESDTAQMEAVESEAYALMLAEIERSKQEARENACE